MVYIKNGLATILKFIHIRKKWMKWSTYFVTIIPRDQSEGRLQGKDETEQVSLSGFL